MMLEIIGRGGKRATHQTPILCVHGGWHSAWCWADNFLDFFADRGFHAVGVSLRGHGMSGSTKPLQACSFGDYLYDLSTAIDDLGGSPVLIGHSMGGFMVQKYLENHRAPAAVLMASIPPQGAMRATLRLIRRHPATALRAFTVGSTVDFVNTTCLARESLFCAKTPESIIESCVARLQPESVRALALGMVPPRLPKTQRVTTPMLVLGAEDDGMITCDEVHATAIAYQTCAEIFPAMGHDMMLEPGWATVATRITDWLCAKGL